MNEVFNEYKELFIAETEEHIVSLNDSLIFLEKNKGHMKIIDTLFRSAHTIKSSAAALGLIDLSKLAHSAEDVLQKIRCHELSMEDNIIQLLFQVTDIIRDYLAAIKKNQTPHIDIETMIKKLEETLTSEKKHLPLTDPELMFNSEIRREIPWDTLQPLQSNGSESLNKEIWQIDITLDERESLKYLRAEILIKKISTVAEIIQTYPPREIFSTPDFTGVFSMLVISKSGADEIRKLMIIDLVREISVNKLEGSDSAVVPIQPTGTTIESNPVESEPAVSESADQGKGKSGDTIRVAIDKLDSLINLIGEMATTITGMSQLRKELRTSIQDKSIYNKVILFTDRMSVISKELQYNIMITRMLSVNTIFHQFQRVVRDIARDEKKQVELVFQGEKTELDKKIIDALNEPMMHLVRNAVDHGIETPAERINHGKNACGTITLSAERSGNHIIISVSDNGEGIDPDKIRKKIIEKKFVNAGQAEEMNDDQIIQYIFEPGFSTSARISSLSGRGVGLDIVKTVVESLSGSIIVKSEKGHGTEFQLLLPLTLATTGVMLARAGTGLFAVPINDVIKTLVVSSDHINDIEGERLVRIKDEIFPLINLSLFSNGIPSEIHPLQTVIIVTSKGKKLGLMIDKIAGTDEVVIKNLEKNFHAIPGISGAAILGNGAIALVTDITGIITTINRKTEHNNIHHEIQGN